MPAKKKAAKQETPKKPARKAAPAKRVQPKRAAPKPTAPPAAPSAPAFVERRSQPESPRLRTVAVGLTANDLARSVAWYHDVLGFVVTGEWRDAGTLKGVDMRSGAVELYLGQDDWKKGRGRTKGEGIRIYGRTVQDIDRLAAVVKSNGGVLVHEPRTEPWGERDFSLVDPDGFKITISSGA